MTEQSVQSETLVRDDDNLAVWLHIDRKSGAVSKAHKLSLLNAEIQAICNAHISTLDDGLLRKAARPNPIPRVFIEQGNELSRILWLHWES